MVLSSKNEIELEHMSMKGDLNSLLAETQEKEGELEEMESTQTILIQKCGDKDEECDKLKNVVKNATLEIEKLSTELDNCKNQVNIFKEKAETEEGRI